METTESHCSDGIAQARDDDDAVLREALAFIGDFELEDEDGATRNLFGDTMMSHITSPTPNVLSTSNSTVTAPIPTPTVCESSALIKSSRPSRPHSYSKRRDELQYLRDLVLELELRLGTLRQRAEAQNVGISESTSEKNQQVSPLVTQAWERVAQRQYEQRHRAEVENIKLKRLLEDQIQVGKALERVLCRKRPKDMETFKCQLEKPSRSKKPPAFGDSSQLFSDLFASVETQYVETTRILAKVQHTCPSVNHHEVRLVHDPDAGLVLQTTECRVFPFAYDVTVQEVWDSIPDITIHGPHHIDKTDEQQTIQLEVDVSLASAHAVMQVFIASRRYIEGARTVIVTAAVVDPSEIADMNMDGIHMRHQGWTVLEPVPPSRATLQATRMTSYAIASPVVVHGMHAVADHTRKAGTLTNFVMSALSIDREARHQMLENRLFARHLQDHLSQ